MSLNLSTRSLCAIVASVAGLTAPALASVTVSTLPGGDAEFNTLSNNGTLERAVAEGRIGNNNASNGTWERGIWQLGGVGNPVTTGGATWTSGAAVPFSFSYDGASTVSFVLGNDTLTWNGVAGTFTDIFIRTRNARNDTAISLTDLSLTGLGALGSDVGGTTANQVNYLRIVDTGPFGAFTLSGNATLSWAGAAPNNSAQAFQVKFSNSIPTPASAGVLAMAGLLAGRRRR